MLAHALSLALRIAPPAPATAVAAFRATVEQANACQTLRRFQSFHYTELAHAAGIDIPIEGRYAIHSAFSRQETAPIPDLDDDPEFSGFDGEVWTTKSGVTPSPEIPPAPWYFTCGQPGNAAGVAYTHLRRTRDAGRSYDVVSVSVHGAIVDLFFDPVTHRLAMTDEGDGPASRRIFSDYRLVEGVPFAFAVAVVPEPGRLPTYGETFELIDLEARVPAGAFSRSVRP